MVDAACGVAAAVSLAGFAGPLAWWLDIASHFRVQYALFFAAAAAAQALARRGRMALVMAGLMTLNTLPLLPFLLPAGAVVPPAGRKLRLVLANVNTAAGNPARVMDMVRAEQPDVLVLEEVSEAWLEALTPVLAEFPARCVHPRDDNFGIALLSRLPVLSAKVVWPGPAGVPTIDAVLDLDGMPVRLLATHPLPPKDAEYSAMRNGQLERLAEIVRDTEGRVILTGDLNATPWSAHYRRLVGATGLRSSAEGRGVHPTWPVQVPLLSIPLDHFLYSPGMTVLAHRTGAATGSDHYPIVVDFGLTR